MSGKRIEGCDLRRADFNNTVLTEIEFCNCNLTGVKFFQSRLERVKFTGCNLERSRFSQADLLKVQFIGSNLWHAGFIKSDLTGAIFEKLNLEHVYFYQSKLNGALFGLQEIARESAFVLCDLKNTVFNGIEDETIITNCDFRNADLGGARFAVAAIQNSKYTKTKLTQADFSACSQIAECDFRYSSCVGLNLEGLTIEESDFSWVDLSWLKPKAGVEFRNCDFTQSNLSGFDFGVGGYKSSNILMFTNLSNCLMEQSDFSASEIVLANFENAKIKGSRFTKEQLECLELTAMQLREIKVIVEEVIR